MRYGRKGGDGPNTGKKARTFRVRYDGRVFTKRVFHSIEGRPVALCYMYKNSPYCNTVYGEDNLPEWSKSYDLVTVEEIL
jgi:hypothetical protein